RSANSRFKALFYKVASLLAKLFDYKKCESSFLFFKVTFIIIMSVMVSDNFEVFLKLIIRSYSFHKFGSMFNLFGLYRRCGAILWLRSDMWSNIAILVALIWDTV
ncbi:MAG: hypothetical protein ACI9RO_001497, partial [Alteromonas macleodii]